MFRELYDKVKEKIKLKIPHAEVYIRDPLKDGAHLEALVIAPEFQGLSLLAQHRLVKEALGDLLGNELHALALKTFTPEKWEKEKEFYILKE
ncbi:MAG: BolA/IbaG family iron-sulfur metabolism protein [Leptospiraceae bacterium]|nr:BolA/IbaG family iron-sulfur metabolism protein [Leptospiraceae bacterium]MDW8305528.1 BolA/IbaG family iron-sulfur metabolism protein [Leptospiraceae bacterium]